MKPMSNQVKALLRDYRAAESLGASARARALDTLSVRIAAQDWPVDGLDVAPPEPVTQGLLAKAFAGPFGKIGLAVILAAVPSAWLLHSASDAPAILASLPPHWHEARRAARSSSRRSPCRASRTQAPQAAEPVLIAPSATGHQPVASAPARARRRANSQEDPNHSESLDRTPDVMEAKPLAPTPSGRGPRGHDRRGSAICSARRTPRSGPVGRATRSAS